MHVNISPLRNPLAPSNSPNMFHSPMSCKSINNLNTIRPLSPSPVRKNSKLRKTQTPLSSPTKNETLLDSPVHHRLSDKIVPKMPMPEDNSASYDLFLEPAKLPLENKVKHTGASPGPLLVNDSQNASINSLTCSDKKQEINTVTPTNLDKSVRHPSVESEAKNSYEEESSFLAISKSIRKQVFEKNNALLEEKALLSTGSYIPIENSNEAECKSEDNPQPAIDNHVTPIDADLVIDPELEESPAATSIKFAKLPSREPFTKRSIGTRLSSLELSTSELKPKSATLSEFAEQTKPLYPDLNSITATTAKESHESELVVPKNNNKHLSIPEVSNDEPESLKPLASAGSVASVVTASSGKSILSNESIQASKIPILSSPSKSPIRSPSKGSIFRNKSNNDGGTSSLLSATFGAFKRAKKLFFEHSHEDSSEESALDAMKTESTSYARSPSRSPMKTIRSASKKLDKQLVSSPLKKIERQFSSSKKNTESKPLSRLLAPTQSSMAKDNSPQKTNLKTDSQTQSKYTTKNLYPEVPKFPNDAKSQQEPQSPHHHLRLNMGMFHHHNHNQRNNQYENRPMSPKPDHASISMNATMGSVPPSPSGLTRSGTTIIKSASNNNGSSGIYNAIHGSPRVAKAQKEDHMQASYASNSAVPTPKSTKLTQQSLKKPNTPSHKIQSSYSLKVPMSAQKDLNQSSYMRKLPEMPSSKPNKTSLISAPLVKAPKAKFDELDSMQKKPIVKSSEIESQKPKMMVRNMNLEKEAAKLQNRQTQAQQNQPQLKPFPRDSISSKRTSDAAFGDSPSKDTVSGKANKQRISSLGEPQRLAPTNTYSSYNSNSNMNNTPSSKTNNTLMKSTLIHQANKIPVVETVKFSTDKLKFASSGSAFRPVNASTFNNNTHNTQLSFSSIAQTHSIASYSNNSNNNRILPNSVLSTPQPNHQQHHQHVELPEIYSESEDDEDGSIILDWANSPELKMLLMQQQQIDPNRIFGPIAPLKLESVFKPGDGARLSKLRPRSSSGNWSNQDKLTQQEIEQYRREMGLK